MNDILKTPSSSQNPPPMNGRSPHPAYVLIMSFGFAILLLAGYLLFDKFSELELQVAELRAQVEKTAEQIQEVSEKSEAARRRALEAEENAQLAARGRAQAEAEKETAQQEMRRIRKEREEELDRMQEALNKIAETRRTALGLVMNLGSDSLKFDFDKATLRPENRELLSRIAGILLTSKDYGISIYGHTDNIGTDEYNLDLSKRRAQTVRDYLAAAGLDMAIMRTKGFGKSKPLVSGTGAAARAKNRRVELLIVDTVVDYKRPQHRSVP